MSPGCPGQANPLRTAARVLFWLVLAYIAFVTLSPIALRPITPFGANTERFLAFAAVSATLMVAYPARRLHWILGLVILTAGLEAAQNLVPGRHGRFADVEVKALGILCGGALGFAADRLLNGRSRRGP